MRRWLKPARHAKNELKQPAIRLGGCLFYNEGMIRQAPDRVIAPWSVWLIACLCLVSAASLFAQETNLGTLEKIATRTQGILATDSPWSTPYIDIDSGVDGPVVLIVGGMHGNEPAGAQAASAIAQWPIVRGRLVVIPRANTLGLDQQTRYVPGVEDSQRDLNRNFPKRGGPHEARSDLAKSIWAFIRKLDPDWLIDLHEGYDYHQINKDSVGSSVIHTTDPPSAKAARLMLDTVNATIERDEHKLVSLSKGPIDSGMARAAIERLGAKGIILETTSKNQPLALRIKQHHIMVHVLLKDIGVLGVGLDEVLAE